MALQNLDMKQHTVADIMIRDVVRVSPDETIANILKRIEQQKIHHIVVMDQDKLTGVISDRDVLKAVSPFVETYSEQRRDRDTLCRKAHHIMTRQPITVNENLSIATAIRLMIQHNISCLPVLSDIDALVGIVTLKSILARIAFPD